MSENFAKYREILEKAVTLAEKAVTLEINGNDPSSSYIDAVIEMLMVLKADNVKNGDPSLQLALIEKAGDYLGHLGKIVIAKTQHLKNNMSQQDMTTEKEEENFIEEDLIQKTNLLSLVNWTDIIGHEYAKTVLREAIIWPQNHPQLYYGEPNHRLPWTGILLFGPAGSSKTSLVYAAASEAKCTFIKIRIGEIMAKYLGDSEKKITSFFKFAKDRAPSVIFVDEIESLMSRRNETSSEDTNRIKAHLLDGMNMIEKAKVTLVGATNLPQLFDSAFKRRFQQRLYIPLPTADERLDIFKFYVAKKNNNLLEQDFVKLARNSDGYSGSDIENVIKEASMFGVRSIIKDFEKSSHVDITEFNSCGDSTVLTLKDIQKALDSTQPTTPAYEILKFDSFARKFGKSDLDYMDMN